MAVTSRRVSFYSEGIKLVGDMYIPSGLKRGEKRSGLVLCQGFATATGGKPFSALPEFGEHFAQQGYVALKFDYRGFGLSAGPRWRLIPQEQVTDIRNALTFLQIQGEVDPTSVGLFGTSFGGSNVVYAAALDRRVRCVVANVPVGCGEKWLRKLRQGWEWQQFLSELEEDWRQRVVTGKSRIVPRTHIQWSSDPNVQALARRIEEEEEFCSALPLETGQAVIEYHPEDVVHLIAPRPILFIGVDGDALTPNELAQEMYERAGQPKRWAIIRGVGDHLKVYQPPALTKVMEEATAWYQRYMPAVPETPQKDVQEAL